MAQAQRVDMSVEEFLVWCQDQDERFELVDGVPIPLRAMSGASTLHDRIASNIIIALGGRLKDGPCWPTTPDTALRTAIKRVRRPDVTVECAPPSENSYEAHNPVATFEILSPTTENTDKFVKLPEYMRHPKLMTIVVVAPRKRSVVVYRRMADGNWEPTEETDPAASINISGTPAFLTIAEIYAGLTVA